MRPASSTRPRVSAPPPAAASSPFSWRWPTEGQLVGTYRAGDPTRQGIDIAGTGGQPVRAAAGGVVVYSGSGLVGYGELVIVKHRSEEHTSELQSLMRISYAVFCLKKKKTQHCR